MILSAAMRRNFAGPDANYVCRPALLFFRIFPSKDTFTRKLNRDNFVQRVSKKSGDRYNAIVVE